MPEPSEIAEQCELLSTYRRTLAHYLRQEAEQGSAYTPPALAHGILTARAEIQRIKAALRHWGQEVEDLPNDEAAPSVSSSPGVVPIARQPLVGGVQLQARQVIIGGDVVGRDKIAAPSNTTADELSRQFARLRTAIEQRAENPNVERAELLQLLERIEHEARQGDAAHAGKIARWLSALDAAASDIAQLTVAVLLPPGSGVAPAVQAVARAFYRAL